jgi:Glutamate synthase central domain
MIRPRSKNTNGSMGTDTPLAVLSERPQPLYNYFQQHQRRQQQPQQRSDRRAQFHRSACPHVHRADQADGKRGDRRRGRDQRFELRVEQQRAYVSVGPPSQHESARAQASNEDGQHRRRSRRRCAEDQPQLAQLGRLVEKRARARSKEQRRDKSEARHFTTSPHAPGAVNDDVR